MGRVIAVYPETDRLIRNLTVRTPTTSFDRPIPNLIVLPIDVETETSRAQNVEDLRIIAVTLVEQRYQFASSCFRSRTLMFGSCFRECVCVCVFLFLWVEKDKNKEHLNLNYSLSNRPRLNKKNTLSKNILRIVIVWFSRLISDKKITNTREQ